MGVLAVTLAVICLVSVLLGIWLNDNAYTARELNYKIGMTSAVLFIAVLIIIISIYGK